jgi:hypothetical protein
MALAWATELNCQKTALYLKLLAMHSAQLVTAAGPTGGPSFPGAHAAATISSSPIGGHVNSVAHWIMHTTMASPLTPRGLN